MTRRPQIERNFLKFSLFRDLNINLDPCCCFDEFLENPGLLEPNPGILSLSSWRKPHSIVSITLTTVDQIPALSLRSVPLRARKDSRRTPGSRSPHLIRKYF